MPARILPLVTGEYYHIINRGINKQSVFLGSNDYKRAIKVLKFYAFNPEIKFSRFLSFPSAERVKLWERIVSKDNKLVEFICFCFMPNHFHLLLKQNKDGGISKFMSNFQNSYTRYLNTKYDQIGPIFQGRFKAVRIEDDIQLLHLSRYIHLNPYSSFIVKTLNDLLEYQWSSLSEYLGEIENEICDKKVILSNFKDIVKYKSFVLDNADYQRTLDKIKHLILGD